MGTVAGEGSFHDGRGTRAEAGVGEDLAEVVWSAEFGTVMGGGVLRKL